MSRRLHMALLATLLLGALVLSTLAAPRAWAASSSRTVGLTSFATTSVTLPHSRGSYLEGYRDGYRQGHMDGYNDCYSHTPRSRYAAPSRGLTLYEQGYTDGYDSGYQAGFNYCND